MAFEQISELVNEFAESAEYVDRHGPIDESSWGLDCGEVEMAISYQPDSEIVTLKAALGTPGEANRLTTYKALLAVTGQARFPGGARMAIAPSGDVVQERDIPADGLDLDTLSPEAFAFYQRAMRGITLVRQLGATDADGEAPQTSNTNTNAIRV